jgi:hypothetical protein
VDGHDRIADWRSIKVLPNLDTARAAANNLVARPWGGVDEPPEDE